MNYHENDGCFDGRHGITPAGGELPQLNHIQYHKTILPQLKKNMEFLSNLKITLISAIPDHYP